MVGVRFLFKEISGYFLLGVRLSFGGNQIVVWLMSGLYLVSVRYCLLGVKVLFCGCKFMWVSGHSLVDVGLFSCCSLVGVVSRFVCVRLLFL